MANLSRPNFFDAGANPPRKLITIGADGQRREERPPNGVTERWVDGQGNVQTIQLIASGLPVTREALDRARSDLRRKTGPWIEHHRCPVASGSMAAEEFQGELAKPCPRSSSADGNGTFAPLKPCPHVAKVIGDRHAAQHEKRRIRDEALNAEKLAKERRELEAIEAQRETQQSMADLVKTFAMIAAGQVQPPSPGAPAPSSAEKPTEKPKR